MIFKHAKMSSMSDRSMCIVSNDDTFLRWNGGNVELASSMIETEMK